MTQSAVERLLHVYTWSFFMAEMLHATNAAATFGQPNEPGDLEHAIIAGRALATGVLEPLVATFTSVHIRVGYIGPALFERMRSDGLAPGPRRVWDRLDEDGRMRACVTIIMPWLLDHVLPYAATAAMVSWI